jgi:DNA-binding Xre family transcriptional regulator
MAIKNRIKILIAEKEIMENRKLTMRIIAQEAGVSTNSLVAYTNQDVVRFDAVVLDAFCKYFNCGVGDILFYEA